MREATIKPSHMGMGMGMGMGITFTKSPAIYTSKGEYFISNSLTERGPILLDVPNGRNELIMSAISTQSIPKLYPIVGLCKELPGIALPPPIPLDLPKTSQSRKTTSFTSHQQIVREQPIKTGSDLLGAVSSGDVQRPSVASVHQPKQTLHNQSMDFSDPISIILRAGEFLHAGDYGIML